MALTCGGAARLSLAAIGGHATDAERLELEGHLATCARCADEHAALASVRRLREAEPDALSPAARERVRRAILAQPGPLAAPAHRLRWPIGLGAGVAVAAGLALWIAGGDRAGTRVLRGDVARSAESGSTAGGGLELRTEGGGEVQLDDARAELARATEIVWRRERRSVELRAGAITIDVQHRPGQRFEVRAPRFLVEVVGTRFTVDLDGVRTERGAVRVLALDGSPIGYVEAGRAWTAEAPATPAATPAAPVSTAAVPLPAPSLTAPSISAPPAEGASPATRPPAPSEAPSAPGRPAEESAAARLGRARRALARGNATEARRAVEPAFRLGRDIAAEARALYAESFLIEGRYTDAVDGYEVVIRDFPSTPQAESALYAVAQLASEHGRAAEARATLQRYLDRYPRGRFAKEAEDRLARISPASR